MLDPVSVKRRKRLLRRLNKMSENRSLRNLSGCLREISFCESVRWRNNYCILPLVNEETREEGLRALFPFTSLGISRPFDEGLPASYCCHYFFFLISAASSFRESTSKCCFWEIMVHHRRKNGNSFPSTLWVDVWQWISTRARERQRATTTHARWHLVLIPQFWWGGFFFSYDDDA